MRLVYWIRQSLKMTMIILAGSAAYTVMMAVQGTVDGIMEALEMGGMFLMMFGAMISTVLNTTVYQLHIPLTLSFGSTRKEAFAGIQLYRLINGLIVVLGGCGLYGFTGALGDEGLMPAWCFGVLGMGGYLLMGAFGILMGILSNKLGKVALGVMSAVVSLLGMVAIGGAVLGLELGFGLERWMVWIVLALGAVVYGLMLIPEVRTLKKFCVR